jgi:hypothetical protein
LTFVTDSGRKIASAVGARNDSKSGSAQAPSAKAAGKASNPQGSRLEVQRLEVNRTEWSPNPFRPGNDLKTNFASPSRQPQVLSSALPHRG